MKMGKVTKAPKSGKHRNRMQLHREVQRILMKEKQNVIEMLDTTNLVQPVQIQNSEIPNRSSIEQLSYWAIKHNIAKRAVNDLLKILRSIGLIWLPTDSRSLCKTPRSVELTSLACGKYWYNGIESNLRKVFSKLEKNIVIQLNFNVDGVPLFRSSSTQFWPILANIHSKLNVLTEIAVLTKSYH